MELTNMHYIYILLAVICIYVLIKKFAMPKSFYEREIERKMFSDKKRHDDKNEIIIDDD